MSVNHIELILSKCTDVLEGKNLSIILDLFLLKLLNDQFETERLEIRQDFLLQGICSREVDGLIDEPNYYKSYYIPKMLRWNYVKKQVTSIYEALEEIVGKDMGNLIINNSTSNSHVQSFQIKKLFELLDVCDLEGLSDLQKDVFIKNLKIWARKNHLNFRYLDSLINKNRIIKKEW